MIKLNLPFWLDGPQLAKLKSASQTWWGKVEGWLQWPLLQMDADTCHLTVLDLLAWQRDISRFKDEPESLYRLRVKFAFINAVDAGSTAGLKRILQRLGVGYVEIDERMPDRDWDVVLLRLSDSQLSQNPELMRVLIQQYGRTCRRYDFVTITPVSLRIVAVDFNDDQQTLVASL
ncbi:MULTISPECIES: phage tail protein [Pseudomonas]|uniref:Phage tail protein (Tail P2_I) n=2 Tax=Pseudomonas TaxID=286 RepID=A0A120G4V1_PSEFL|nr:MULTISPECIES: phage tail protein [Pseudomonas]KWV83114.1 Phage tail protein (Tail P2_I) [Pseudomonas fluorescens]MBJ2225854.1 phage tail protein [Pseudomonas sp. MF7451]MBJ2303275.1 phage tail protein [Pseudomonas sp. MF2846]MBK3490528.1 phage tail protein [Pseudomonas sp. MF2857]MDD1942317.1 phage tail protein [Pseudomonas carnis]